MLSQGRNYGGAGEDDGGSGTRAIRGGSQELQYFEAFHHYMDL